MVFPSGPKRGLPLLVILIAIVVVSINSGGGVRGEACMRLPGSLSFGEGSLTMHPVDLGEDASAREFRATLTYTPDSLPVTSGDGSSPPDVHLSFFISSTDPRSPFALADYQQPPALTLISSTDLAVPLPRYVTFYVMATGQSVLCASAPSSPAFDTLTTASGIHLGSSPCTLSSTPTLVGSIITSWTGSAGYVLSLSGVGNSTNTPPYVSWINTTVSSPIFLGPGASYTSPPFHVLDAEDTAPGLVSISSIEARNAALLSSVTFSRTAYDLVNRLSTYVIHIEAGSTTGQTDMYMNITDILSTVQVPFEVVVEEAPQLATNYTSNVAVVHGQRSPPIYFSVISALSCSFNVSSPLISTSYLALLEPGDLYSLEFTASSDLSDSAASAVLITVTNAVGSSFLSIPITVINNRPFFEQPAVTNFVVDRHQEVTTPVVLLRDADDNVTTTYEVSASGFTALGGVFDCPVELVRAIDPNSVQFRARFVANFTANTTNVVFKATNSYNVTAFLALSYTIIEPMMVNLSLPGPFCAREAVPFQIANTVDLAPQVVVRSSNETVIPSNGFSQTINGRDRTVFVSSSASVSPGWTDVTITAVDNSSRRAKATVRMNVFPVECNGGAVLPGKCGCDCAGVVCNGALNSTTCKCSCSGVMCLAGATMDPATCACVSVCPADRPIKCSNLKCVSSALYCQSESEQQQTCNYTSSPGLLRCADSSCSSGCSGCMAAQQPCPSGASRQCCSGKCVSKLSDCAVVSACQVLEARCLSGVCVSNLTQCTSDQQLQQECSTLFGGRGSMCADGVCRNSSMQDAEGNVCPPFNGCPALTYRCADGRCADSPSACLCSKGLIRCSTGQCVDQLSKCPGTPQVSVMPKPVSLTFTNTSSSLLSLGWQWVLIVGDHQVTIGIVSDDVSNAELGSLVIPPNTFPALSSIVIKPVADSYLSSFLSSAGRSTLSRLGSSLAAITLQDENGTEIAVHDLAEGVELSLRLLSWPVHDSSAEPLMVFLNLTTGLFQSVEEYDVNSVTLTNVTLPDGSTSFFLTGKLRHFTDFGVLLPANSDKSTSGSSDVWVIGVAVAVPIAVAFVVAVIAGALVWSYIQRRRSRSTEGTVFFNTQGDEDEDDAL